ncbi:MAG: peptide ABC transporter substrate-binding protein [Parachlamydiaceae bacterium]|nr:peptide ABC transporter substrate-binding protein [Parachlamydiaceae bacterium]
MFTKTIHSIIFFFVITSLLSCQKQTNEPHNTTTIRISTEDDPKTLDPRQARDLATATTIHMLYEGLMRLNEEGIPTLAIAEDVNTSEDLKTYTFKIRKSAWSNGKPVTASDFEKTWKTVLDPNFPAPNAYQLYVIKGAKDAKEGKISLNDVGIKAPDDATLIVELENPTPYFLNLAASYFYYPVSAEMREIKDSNSENNKNQVISNGPFKLKEWSKHNQFVAEKNPNYWGANSIEIDTIKLIVLDNSTALSLFENGDLDWVGSPLSTIPTDALVSLKKQNRLNITPSAGVYLFRFNTLKPPFDQQKFRQAFSLALNRQDLVEHILQGNQTPAMGIIPPSFMKHKPHFSDNNIAMAQQLFNEALAENHITKEQLPPITLCYANTERTHKIAQVAQQQWKQAFGIDLQLQSSEGKVFYDRLKSKDYQIGIGSWFADIRDPISFLEVFKLKDNGTNNTGWENPEYVKLLDLSSQTNHFGEREKLLTQAETVLMKDMPIAPLFYNSYNYLKKPNIKDVYFSELGYLDFKNAYIE